MAAPNPQGSVPPPGLDEAIRAALTKALGAANLQDKAFGYGKPKAGVLVGKHNAVWSTVRLLAGADLNDVEVPHSLGDVPVVCQLHHWDNATTPDVFFIARPILAHKWTKSTCRVAVKMSGSGSADDTVLTFLVGGE